MRRFAGLALLVLVSVWGQGCDVPGVTESLEPVCDIEFEGIALSPDSSQFTYGLEVNHYRNSYISEFIHYDYCNFELYTYDLAKRTGPTRIGSWRRSPTEKFHVQLWDQDGIVLIHEISHQDRTHYSVERKAERVGRAPLGPTRTVLSPDAAKAAYDNWEKTNPSLPSQDQRDRFHVEESALQLFLWHPQEHERELLFSIPLEHDGHRETTADMLRQFRDRDRYLDQISQLRGVSPRADGDSVRFSLTTYVPRPGVNARFYWIRATLDVPDTVAAKDKVYQSNDVPLPDQPRVLGPKAGETEYVVAYRDLRRMLMPSLKALHWDRDRSFQAWMWVRLVPQPLPSDQGKGASGVLDGSFSQGRTWFDVPLH